LKELHESPSVYLFLGVKHEDQTYKKEQEEKKSAKEKNYQNIISGHF
jgi:hypothetical protein